MMMMRRRRRRREADEMLMRDQTTEQEKVLLQIRNVFFDTQESKFPSGYDPRRRGVLCWLTSGPEKKEVKINVCVYILDIARNMPFAACFRGCGSTLALRYGNLRIATQHFKWSFAKRQENGVPKWCIEKKHPFLWEWSKKRGKVLRRSWSSTHHGTEARPAFELNRSARMMWCISFSRTGGGLFKGILLKRVTCGCESWCHAILVSAMKQLLEKPLIWRPAAKTHHGFLWPLKIYQFHNTADAL